MRARGISQRQLAIKAKASQTSVSMFAQGTRVNFRVLARLCDTLGLECVATVRPKTPKARSAKRKRKAPAKARARAIG